MNSVVASRPPGPVTRTSNMPSWTAWGKSGLMFSWKLPADGVTWTVRVTVWPGPAGGGGAKVSVTVTG